MKTRFSCTKYLKQNANFKSTERVGDMLLNCHMNLYAINHKIVRIHIEYANNKQYDMFCYNVPFYILTGLSHNKLFIYLKTDPRSMVSIIRWILSQNKNKLVAVVTHPRVVNFGLYYILQTIMLGYVYIIYVLYYYKLHKN